MADGESSGNTGVVAILVIFLIVVVLAVLAWQGGIFGGGKTTKIDVNVDAPSAPATK
jgi:ABC-type transporter Mla subunit MlaD